VILGPLAASTGDAQNSAASVAIRNRIENRKMRDMMCPSSGSGGERERERDAEQRVVELLGDVVVGGNADNTSRGE
jgi:hypothetical protein